MSIISREYDPNEIIRVRSISTGKVFEYRGWFPYPKVLDLAAATEAVKKRQNEERNRKIVGRMPYEVKKQVDEGALELLPSRWAHGGETVPGPSDTVVTEDARAVDMDRPKDTASREAWILYAMTQGMPMSEAVTLPKADLKARFEDTGFDPDARPVLVDDVPPDLG